METVLALGFFVAALIPLAIIILLVVYINKTNALSNRVTAVESLLIRLRSLEDEIANLRNRMTPAEDRASQSAATKHGPLPPATPVAGPRTETASVDPVKDTRSLPVPSMIPEKSIPPSRTREEWESIIGGKLLNRIGALALIIGIGFFLKYAFDNNWITETMRVLIGFVIGAGLLVGAARTLKMNFEVFSQGLAGAGISVLYLSVFASFSYYHLVPQTVAFLMMSGVTVLAFLQAFRYDSLAVSLLGLVGGFLTPFLLSTGESNEIGLFTYIALLNAGILAVLLMKDRWAVLEPLSLAATWLIYLLWYKAYYDPGNILSTVYFLIVFWALFHALDVYRILKSIGTFKDVRIGVAAANALFFYSALYSLIEPDHHEVMGLVTLLVGVVYFGIGLIVKRHAAGTSNAFSRQVIIAIIMLVVATAIEFSGFRTVVWWSVEALVLMLCGLRWRYRFVWISTAVIYALALLKLLYQPDSLSTSPVVEAGLLLNLRSFTFLLLSASMAIGGEWLGRDADAARISFARVLNYIWPTLVFVVITVETTGYFKTLKLVAVEDAIDGIRFREVMTLSIFWVFYSLPLLWFGMARKIAAWQHVAIAVTTLAVCLAGIRGISYAPLSDFQLIANYRVMALLVVVAGLVIHMQWIRNGKPFGSWNADLLGTAGVIAVVLLLDLVTGETKDYFEKAKLLLGDGSFGGEYLRLSNLQQLSLSGVWLIYSIALMAVGIWRRQRGIRIVSIVLFGFTILKIFIYDLSFLETLYRIFSFIGLGVILLAVSYLYQKYKGIILGEAVSEKHDQNAPAQGSDFHS